MADAGTFKIKAYDGEIKEVKKIALFPEKDRDEEIFYKIEGWNNISYFMIFYSYDRGEAWGKYLELLQKLIDYQVNSLTGVSYEKSNKEGL